MKTEEQKEWCVRFLDFEDWKELRTPQGPFSSLGEAQARAEEEQEKYNISGCNIFVWVEEVTRNSAGLMI